VIASFAGQDRPGSGRRGSQDPPTPAHGARKSAEVGGAPDLTGRAPTTDRVSTNILVHRVFRFAPYRYPLRHPSGASMCISVCVICAHMFSVQQDLKSETTSTRQVRHKRLGNNPHCTAEYASSPSRIHPCA
jgi:hypothetical protein